MIVKLSLAYFVLSRLVKVNREIRSERGLVFSSPIVFNKKAMNASLDLMKTGRVLI
jgi:hypothetical protein